MQSFFHLRGIVFSALFAALLCVLSLVNINLGFSPVPISLENFVVMLAGAILGARYGFFSIMLVVVLAALGLPLLHGQGGIPLILGPTGGFIWAFPFAALLIGWIVPRIRSENKVLTYVMIFLTMTVFGSFMLYIPGVPWLAHAGNLSLTKAMALGCYPYIPGDLVKAAIATAIVIAVRRVYPAERLLGQRTHREVNG